MSEQAFYSIRHVPDFARTGSTADSPWRLCVGTAVRGSVPADVAAAQAAPAELKRLRAAIVAAAPPAMESRFGIVDAAATSGNAFCAFDFLQKVPAARVGRWVIAAVGPGAAPRPDALGRLAAQRLCPVLARVLFTGLYGLEHEMTPAERAAAEAERRARELADADREAARLARERREADRAVALATIGELTGGDLARAEAIVLAVAVVLGVEPPRDEGRADAVT